MANLDWRGKEIADRIDTTAKNAVRGAAELLRDEAVQRTPVETGTLRATASVIPNGDDTAVVSYGTVYARRQHEEVGWQHPGGGEAKFLENAMHAKRQDIARFIQSEIRKAIR